MGRLNIATAYFCGHVENDYDPTDNWRTTLGSDLSTIIPTCWSPLLKPDWMPLVSLNVGTALDKEALFSDPKRLKIKRRQAKCFESNQICRHVCQCLAGQCTILIARLINKFTWGSIDELEIAARRRIPIFLWLPDGPLGLYGMPGIISSPELIRDYVFYTKESLVAKLQAINNGTDNLPERDPERWLFLTFPNITKDSRCQSK